MDKALETPVEVKTALTNLFIDGKLNALPDDLKQALRGLTQSGVNSVTTTINLVEAVYDRMDDDALPVELLQLAVEAASVATEWNYHGFAASGRGLGIAREVKKKPGVVKAPAKAPTAAPERSGRFKRADPAPAPEGGAVAPPGTPPTGNAGQGNKPA